MDDRALIELVVHAGNLRAVVVTARKVNAIDLGAFDAVTARARRTASVMGQLAASGDGRGAVLLHLSARAALVQLRTILVEPIAASITSYQRVVVVPIGPLFAVPWRYILGPDRVVTVAPSARNWVRSPSASVDRIHAVATAGPGLPGAVEEAARVAQIHPSATLLTGDTATAPAFVKAIEHATVAHVAAHARFRSGNPLFSHLLLADGPLTAHDLDGLRSPPRIVVLSGCSSATVSSRAGGELLGLSTVLLAGGCAGLVVTTLPLADTATVPLVERLHHELASGRPLGEAVTAAANDSDVGTPQGLVDACRAVVLRTGRRQCSARSGNTNQGVTINTSSVRRIVILAVPGTNPDS